ncbi:class I SAM-dependent methyltransferase [Phenylobacterium sp.]|uniref:class I SAM-dependent methyltransferase n=1 Tax=Phenylobacterium sp. TaxID=1871053 RepID=UPI0039833F1E
MSGRVLNEEFAETEARKYAYDFDYRMHDYMLRTFRDLLPPGRALELGCFEGEFTKKLAAIFSDLTVVEGSSDLIGVARTKAPPPVAFVLSRFEAFQPEQRFDAVFLIHTLEHMDAPVDLLKRIGTWLTPQGRLFLVVPNAHAASRQIAVEMGLIAEPTAVTEGEYLHGHRRTYNAQTLLADVQAAGLRPLETGGVFFKPFANFQFDKLMKTDIVGDGYMEGCFKLGRKHPDLCASIYAICESTAGTEL